MQSNLEVFPIVHPTPETPVARSVLNQIDDPSTDRVNYASSQHMRNYENLKLEDQLDYNLKSSDDESSSDESSHINRPARRLSKKYLESEVL